MDPDADTAEQSAPAALGLSKAFDSLDATMRLAVNTGMATDMKSLSPFSSDKTGGVNASPGYHIMAGRAGPPGTSSSSRPPSSARSSSARSLFFCDSRDR